MLSSTPDAERDVEIEYLPATARRASDSRSHSRRKPLETTLWVLTGVGVIIAIVTLFWSRGYDIASVRDSLLSYADPTDGGGVLEEAAAPPKSKPGSEAFWKGQVAQWVNGEPTEHFQGVPACASVRCILY